MTKYATMVQKYLQLNLQKRERLQFDELLRLLKSTETKKLQKLDFVPDWNHVQLLRITSRLIVLRLAGLAKKFQTGKSRNLSTLLIVVTFHHNVAWNGKWIFSIPLYLRMWHEFHANQNQLTCKPRLQIFRHEFHVVFCCVSVSCMETKQSWHERIVTVAWLMQNVVF